MAAKEKATGGPSTADPSGGPGQAWVNQVMRKLRVPPGMDPADVRQEIMAAWSKRTSSGDFADPARLFMRVWGDVKDVLGKPWRQYYAGRAEHPQDLTGLIETHTAPSGPDQGAVMDVREAVTKLTPKQRLVVERMAFQGAHRDDVAREMGISPHGVTVLMCRAKDKLRELLVDYAPEEPDGE